ncbi:type II secretion system F family protein [Sulfuriroseicoccus oceanibius]|uniref:Type II secretion system F family protein n=1 Tax=Sulfuriroseicoccus oceanibius TaxID=2707525 RepID=A0A6B3L9W4_9BACT|nr:type II secretion system F family protein [Sulfuriroseicoccus oceanibius]QQL44487.1 type II secretion system F family protein [Sulfuriroseicoccus oceanibius]
MPPLNQVPSSAPKPVAPKPVTPKPPKGAAKEQTAEGSAPKKEKKSLASKEIEIFGPKKIKMPEKELIKFYRGMASMLRSQINTGDALKYYAHGMTNRPVADKVIGIQEAITAGVPIHEAFRKSELFDDTTIGLVQAGTESGQLDQAFTAVAHRIKTAHEFKVKVRKAIAVPLVVISLLIFAFIMSQVKIVPQVEEMLMQVAQEPDAFTGLIFKMSHFTQEWWSTIVIAIVIAVVAIVFSEGLRTIITNIAMSKWRLLRNLIMGLRQMTFLGTMHMLHSNGINLAKAIQTAASSVKGTPMHDELKEAANKYQETGLPVSEAFKKFTSCDPQVSHMLFIGERAASIDTQLKMLSEMYEEDTRAYMEDFTAALNLVVLIVAVILIATVFIGTFLPIFLMGPKMMQGGNM